MILIYNLLKKYLFNIIFNIIHILIYILIYIYMSLNPNAQSFVSRMNINAPSFVPHSLTNAAKNIQRTYRGNNARRNLTRKKQAATKIQSRLRGNRSRTGKSEKWGLPFPKSRRDLDVDPFLRRRVYNESLTGRREGVIGVEDEIDELERDNRYFQKLIDQTEKDSKNPKSTYSMGKKAKQARLERYSRSAARGIKGRLDAIAEESGKQSQQYADALQEAMGYEDLEDIYESFLESNRDEPYIYYDPNAEASDPNLSPNSNMREERLSKLYVDREIDNNMYNRMIEENKGNIELLEKEKEDIDKLDIFKCKDIKAMAQADHSLYLDKTFLENKIKPCRDELTKVYIDTFYQLPWQLIMPDGWSDTYIPYREIGVRGEGYLDQIVSGFLLNEINTALKPMAKRYSNGVVNALKDVLMTMGLIMTPEQISRTRNTYLAGTYYGMPTNNFVLLSNFYKFAVANSRTVLKHLPKNPRYDGTRRFPEYPYVVGRVDDEERGIVGIDGRDALEYTLNYFHDTVLDRKLKLKGKLINNDDIEKMKRYFILRLIGLIDNPQYILRLREKIRQLERHHPKNESDVPKSNLNEWKIKRNKINKFKLIEQNLLAYPFN